MAENQNPTADEQEKAFWEKLTQNIDSWWDNKMKTYENARTSDSGKGNQDPPAGTSRTGGGRVTLPGLIADIVFGPKKD